MGALAGARHEAYEKGRKAGGSAEEKKSTDYPKKEAKLDPKLYSRIKDAPKAAKKGKELVMKSLGGGSVGGHGKAQVSGFPKSSAAQNYETTEHVLDRGEALGRLLGSVPVGIYGGIRGADAATSRARRLRMGPAGTIAAGVGGAALTGLVGAGIGGAAGGSLGRTFNAQQALEADPEIAAAVQQSRDVYEKDKGKKKKESSVHPMLLETGDSAGRVLAHANGIEKDAIAGALAGVGKAMLGGAKGMGRFGAATAKNVGQAARSGGAKAVGQTLGGAGQMGVQQAAQFAKKNPLAAMGLAGGAGLAAGGLGGAAAS